MKLALLRDIVGGIEVNVPIRFEPFLRPMVWGGRRLREVLGKPTQGKRISK